MQGSPFVLFILRVKPIKLASCFMFSWNKVYLPLVCKAATRHDTIEQLGGESSAVLFSRGAGLGRHCSVTGVTPPERPVGQVSHAQMIKYSTKLIPLALVCILQLCYSDLHLAGEKTLKCYWTSALVLPRATCTLARLSACHRVQRKHKTSLCLPYLKGPDRCSQLPPARSGPVQTQQKNLKKQQ